MEKETFTGFNVFRFRRFLFPVFFILSLCVLILLRCSEEVPVNHRGERFEASPGAIIYEYHKLYTEVESMDMFMSPIISARYLMTLNIAVNEAVKASTNPENYTLDFKFSPKNVNTKIKDTLLLNNLLNAVLANHMSNMFANRVHKSDRLIEGKYTGILSMINSENKINSIDHTFISSLAKSISDSIKSVFLPEDYYLKDKYSVRDSVTTIVVQKSVESEVTWVKSLIRYESILPALGLKPINLPPKIKFRPLNDKDMYREAMEIYTLSKPLPYESEWIAEFWSDDLPGITFTPATRWINILNQLVIEEKPDFYVIKNMYFYMSLAIHETGVLCWDLKYSNNQVRPSHFIQYHIDPTWRPFHENPDFPAYPSGHSAFGAAACTVLENFFGKEHPFTDNSHKGNKAFLSEPRNFKSFQEMKEENARSRMYLGVHFRKDCEDGLYLGDIIGKNIMEIYLSKNPDKRNINI
ncbi:MAG: vanadium-dependent haloperoxidase [Saprospiraceae bacterium]|nr:vanadium-dependent haloperoxidase [Saprospiraceae bacterium]